MAAVVFNVSYQLTDDNGIPSAYELRMNVPSGLFADAQTAANSFAATLDAITQSQITRIVISADNGIPGGLKTAPVSESNNAVGALFDFAAGNAYPTYSRTVPNFLPTAFIPPAHAEVYSTGAAGTPGALVAAYIAAMTTGITGGVQAVDTNGNVLALFRTANKNNRSQRRGLSKRRHRIGR